jgi:uncharacterized protein YndB with AHSA1/START domain
MTQNTHKLNPKLDLVLERFIDAPKDLVWDAWTKPEHLKRWFTPAPWTTPDCEIDLRPGGIFRTVSRSPEGDEHTNLCCYLEVVPGERLVWTMALGPGFRPSPGRVDVPLFTAIISFQAQGKGTKYTAIAMHQDEAGQKKHAELGFYEGWGAVTDQLVRLVTKRS